MDTVQAPESNPVEMRVSGTTNVTNLAASIGKTINRGATVRLIAIGATSINQMVKAAASSARHTAHTGKQVSWRIFFMNRPAPEAPRNVLRPDLQAILRQLTPEDPENRGSDASNGTKSDTWTALVFESVLE